MKHETPIFKEGDFLKIAGRTKEVTWVLPIRGASEIVEDYYYELDDDPDQRYTTDEINDLIADS